MTEVDDKTAATSNARMEDSRASPDLDFEVKTWRPSNQTYVVLLIMCIIRFIAGWMLTYFSIALPVCPLLFPIRDTNTILTPSV